ncbi:sulfatase family protein [Snuella sedimenti]|uniref:Sulfatase-like hydrolase/transferase n=1 Tax=Snuella sedimenti TaxID=2798802 RepID=A0A8J7IW18_9FLAO|nr:arylsulfatase [Snuella sedimenti]MBJ6368065.1 sulfatase-like hydrolase/transferase [Snuella sedimenti]
MIRSYSIVLPFLILTVIGCKNTSSEKEKLSKALKKPNIVMIYADDLGYGDVSAYGATAIQTPAIDALAKEGITFSNAYATAATCTPSRYSLLTGVYAWRQKGNSIASGDQPLLFDTSKPTLASILQSVGYKTGVVGKWHLGLGGKEGPDWNGDIKPGPLEIGFDYSFLIPATGDRVPCVYVENHNIVNLDPSDPIQVNYKEKIGNWPTGSENPELLKVKPSQGHANTIVNGISRIGFMEGGKAALWDDETIAQELVKKSVDFINTNKEAPFFLFLSTHDIHVPRVANAMFQGKSGMGPRGDVILQLDWTVKQIVSQLKSQNLLGKTVIIFSSDNGPVVDDGYHDQARELLGGHKPAGNLRGGKYSALEGGSKIPLIVKWPDGKAKGMVSKAMFSQIDFFKSLGKLAGVDISGYKNIDSQDQLATLRGDDKKGRETLIQESFAGPLSYIKGHWKYIEPLEGPKLVPWGPIIETGFEVAPQLYNLEEDPEEQNNIAKDYPEKTEALRAALMEARKGLSFTMFKPKVE